VVLLSRPGKSASAMTPGRAKMNTGEQVQKSREHSTPPRLVDITRAQHTLHIHLVYAPIKSSAVKGRQDHPQKRVVRIIVGSMDVNRLRHLRNRLCHPPTRCRPVRVKRLQPTMIIAVWRESV
jgi:hypothetical protein